MTRAGICLAALLALGGCRTVVVMGRMPDTELLESRFVLEKTTRLEVLHELGRPQGCGSVQFPDDPAPRDLCYFYLGEATMKDTRQKFLFVFFQNGLYDGYMWFSSLPAGVGDAGGQPPDAPKTSS